jgi:hypothetical protein
LATRYYDELETELQAVLRNRNHSAMDTDEKISPETRRRTDEEQNHSETYLQEQYATSIYKGLLEREV